LPGACTRALAENYRAGVLCTARSDGGGGDDDTMKDETAARE